MFKPTVHWCEVDKNWQQLFKQQALLEPRAQSFELFEKFKKERNSRRHQETWKCLICCEFSFSIFSASFFIQDTYSRVQVTWSPRKKLGSKFQGYSINLNPQLLGTFKLPTYWIQVPTFLFQLAYGSQITSNWLKTPQEGIHFDVVKSCCILITYKWFYQSVRMAQSLQVCGSMLFLSSMISIAGKMTLICKTPDKMED